VGKESCRLDRETTSVSTTYYLWIVVDDSLGLGAWWFITGAEITGLTFMTFGGWISILLAFIPTILVVVHLIKITDRLHPAHVAYDEILKNTSLCRSPDQFVDMVRDTYLKANAQL